MRIAKLLCGVLAAALILPTLGSGFDNTEPLAPRQGYLTDDRAWSFWPTSPELEPVKVAVIDSGIDYGHPEFAGRIVGGKSFVRGSWKRDDYGHGTFVAGIIAADPANGQGIAGLAFNARLLIARIVPADESGIDIGAEVAAIRWAVDSGARVINLSFGGRRDPADRRYDAFSREERSAIEYAVSKGVVVIAAVGNGTDAPSMPWPFAEYPAAMPHVLGVSALRRNGSVPRYSNRDRVFLDVAAPVDGPISTVPRNLVKSSEAGCARSPYSPCGPSEFRGAIGTSFAAPQVAAAAALLLGVNPKLTPDQVSWLLERSARDARIATGCRSCTTGRDSSTGWGRLDVRRALALLQGGIPSPDVLEPNESVDSRTKAIRSSQTISASLDPWDDPLDVYRVELRKGQRLEARLSSPASRSATLSLRAHATARGATRSNETRIGTDGRASIVASAAGVYDVSVGAHRGARSRLAYALELEIGRG